MKKISFATLFVIPVLILAGCGGSEEKAKEKALSPSDTVKTFWAHAMDGKTKEACSLVSEKGKKELTTDMEEGATCESSVKETATFLKSEDGKGATVKIGKETVKGDSATVSYDLAVGGESLGEGDLKLSKVDGKWLIDGEGDN